MLTAWIHRVRAMPKGLAKNSEDALNSRAERNAFWIISIATACFALVNALSSATDFDRSGADFRPTEPFIWEVTSAIMIIALTPAVMAVTRWFPTSRETWRTWLPAHAAASVAFSLVHIAGMVALRKFVYAIALAEPYVFFGDVIQELIYEYRKDALTYALVVGVTMVAYQWQAMEREVAAARKDAQRNQRITLKCGGRTEWVDASTVAWVKAASNYVEVRAGARTLLARATLTAVEQLLREAGVPAARVHRSYVVNSDHVATIAPTGEGDALITMRSGDAIPASRRCRDEWPKP